MTYNLDSKIPIEFSFFQSNLETLILVFIPLELFLIKDLRIHIKVSNYKTLKES